MLTVFTALPLTLTRDSPSARDGAGRPTRACLSKLALRGGPRGETPAARPGPVEIIELPASVSRLTVESPTSACHEPRRTHGASAHFPAASGPGDAPATGQNLVTFAFRGTFNKAPHIPHY
ncbi:hypothetical protein GCM10010277_26200 [Streptomyces longisporoflavus]|nr:hypothetical protein GCM10010277_26200 [Streptomyces longisporoflavus]